MQLVVCRYFKNSEDPKFLFLFMKISDFIPGDTIYIRLYSVILLLLAFFLSKASYKSHYLLSIKVSFSYIWRLILFKKNHSEIKKYTTKCTCT